MDDQGLYFGLWVKETRAKLNISSRKLSEEILMSPSYISQIERGLVKTPSLEIAQKICISFGLTAEETYNELHKYGFIKSFNENGEQQIGSKIIEEADRVMEHEILEKIKHMNYTELRGLYGMLNDNRDFVFEVTKTINDLGTNKSKQILSSVTRYLKFLKVEQGYEDDK